MRDYFDKAIRYFIYLAGSGGLCTLLWIVLAIPVRFILKESNNKILWELITGVVVFTVICFGVMCFCGYKIGYKSGEFKAKKVLIPISLACVIHFIYSSVFQFAVYTTAPAFYLGAVIYHVTVRIFDRVPLPVMYRIMTLWVFYIIYMFSALFGEKYGVKKRLKDRENLINNSK